MRNKDNFSYNIAFTGGLLDSDSGLEVSSSTFHSFPSYMTINEQDNLLDINESFSSLSDTATILNGADQLDTSQDSVLDDDDNASTVSHLSDISGLSDLSGQDWKPKTGCMIWVSSSVFISPAIKLIISIIYIFIYLFYFFNILLIRFQLNRFKNKCKKVSIHECFLSN